MTAVLPELAAAAAAWCSLPADAGRRMSDSVRPKAGPLTTKGPVGWCSDAIRAVDLGPLTDKRAAPLVALTVFGLLVVPLGWVPALAATIVTWALIPGVREGLLGRRTRARETSWQAALRAVAGSLEAGGTVAAALRRGASAGAEGDPEVARQLSAVAATADTGGDPATALADRCRIGSGAALAAVLALADDLGAPPAALAGRLADSLAAQARSERAAVVAMAGARSTARMLGGLPVAGIGLAAAFGASAPSYLLGTRTGHVCLLLAAVFEAAGLTWTRRLMTNAARS